MWFNDFFTISSEKNKAISLPFCMVINFALAWFWVDLSCVSPLFLGNCGQLNLFSNICWKSMKAAVCKSKFAFGDKELLVSQLLMWSSFQKLHHAADRLLRVNRSWSKYHNLDVVWPGKIGSAWCKVRFFLNIIHWVHIAFGVNYHAQITLK